MGDTSAFAGFFCEFLRHSILVSTKDGRCCKQQYEQLPRKQSSLVFKGFVVFEKASFHTSDALLFR
jgi:hypothetical protein